MEYVDILKEVNKNEDWEYNENNKINNYLYHQLYYSDNQPDYYKSTQSEKDEFRLNHDCDAYYYKMIGYSNSNALFADSIISFWMPYQSRLNNIGIGRYFKPSKKDLNKTEKFKELINSTNDKILQLNINETISRFAKLIYTKGNFMKLPQISKKYSGRQIQERGGALCDEIDWSIYQCHNGGIYFKYFDYDEDKVNEWIKQEKLEMANKPFLSSGIYKTYYDMTDDEFYEYLDKVIELIEYRNEHYHPEEFVK